MKKKYSQLLYNFIATFVLFLFLFTFTTKAQQSLFVGQSYTFDIGSTILGSPYNMNWSTNGGYLSLSGSGFYRNITITQYFEGTASVTCSWDYTLYYGDRLTHTSRTVYITCRNNPISIYPSELNMNVGERGYVSYSLAYDVNKSYADVYYQSSNTSVATVSSTGEVYAVGPGIAYINVYSKVSAGAPYCVVTVRKVDPTKVKIDDYLTTYVGEGSNLSVSLTPSYAQTTLSWYSTNTNVATVSSSGYVSGKNEGIASIYCVTANGIRSNYCDVSVYYRTPTSITFSTSNPISVPIGHTKSFSYKVLPSNARYTVNWRSEDENVATVSQSGVVTGKKEGKTNIIVTTDNGKSAKCEVIVPPNPTKIELPKKISLYRGKNRTLKYNVIPLNAYCELSWSIGSVSVLSAYPSTTSSNDVVSISQSGEIVALRPGKATINVTTQNGKTASCVVEVPKTDFEFYVWTHTGERIGYVIDEKPIVTYKDNSYILESNKVKIAYPAENVRKFTLIDEGKDPMPNSIKMENNVELRYKQKYKILYTLLPTDYDIETSLTWKSDNTKCVTVNQNGEIYGVAPGEAIVSLIADNGCLAECVVTVLEPNYNFIVWLRNGERNGFSFSDIPKIGYAGNTFNMTTEQAEITYNFADVRKFTFYDGDYDISAVHHAIIDRQDSRLQYNDGMIEMISCKPNSSVIISTIDGKIIEKLKTDKGGNIRFFINGYPKGIYIIKSGKIKFKISKK